jgi:hypothetical protein
MTGVIAGFTSTGIDDNATSTAVTIDASENVLVGKTTTALATVGLAFGATGFASITRDGYEPLSLNRLTSDGAIANFYKDGTTVGSIGSKVGNLTIGNGDTGLYFAAGANAIYPYNTTTQADRDGAIDLGYSSIRYKDLYLSGGVYLGGTGSANHLYDYEEGTFTVTSSDSGGGFYQASGKYVKVGALVHIRAYFGNLGGGVAFSGLPFAAEVTTGLTIQQMYQVNWPSSAKQLLCQVTGAGNNISFRWQTDTGVGAAATSTDFAHSSCTLGIAGTYKTTS